MSAAGPQPRDYYNTNGEAGDVLRESRNGARAQQDAVLALFTRRPEALLAPHEVHEILGAGATPLTSIRRAITNLTEAGLLEKTDERRLGQYGKYVYCWRLRKLVPFTSLPPLPPTSEPALF